MYIFTLQSFCEISDLFTWVSHMLSLNITAVNYIIAMVFLRNVPRIFCERRVLQMRRVALRNRNLYAPNFFNIFPLIYAELKRISSIIVLFNLY